MVTLRQKHAVRFVVTTLRVPFEGDIENYADVSNFLGQYLNNAKLLDEQLSKIEAWSSYQEHLLEIACDFQAI